MTESGAGSKRGIGIDGGVGKSGVLAWLTSLTGCHPSRLRDFVASYYSDSHEQVVDDAYFAFVWSLVVCQPTVRVGTVPDGATTEVYIAPQQSQKRKSKGKDEGGDTSSSVTSLEFLLDARSRTLEDLQSQYGEALRVAVDAETSLVAIVGSHIRPPKLTPMVYTALQFITRAREEGISTVDLGKKTGYDQKTCFYLIKQLLELELVVKLRRGGVGTNFCIHKYFFERNPLWRQIQDEGLNSSKDLQAERGGLDIEEAISTQDGSQAPVQFDPIDARHLSSLSLIQSRIVKLLKHSESQTHPSQNLLVTIGFLNPTKTDRRFFQSRLRELIENRVVERVMVPSTNKHGSASVPCIRLISDNNDVTNEPSETPTHTIRDPSAHDDRPTTVKLNVTLHKQMIDLLENAGIKGMTMNEISRELGNFDRRTLELLLTKLDKVPPPTHLSDLRIVQLMETHGRERRWRYFTFASYRKIIANEKLDDQDGPYSSVDFSNIGNFAPFVTEDFYSDVDELNRFTDYAFSKIGKVEDVGEEAVRKHAKGATPRLTPRGKKRKGGEAGLDADGDGEVSNVPRKRGRPRKIPASDQQKDSNAAEKGVTSTRHPDRSVQGPRASPEATQPAGISATNEAHSTSLSVPTKRRRPPNDSHSGELVPEASMTPRRRGRPRKRPPSPLPTETMEHLPGAYPPDVVANHPVSEPPPNANTGEAEPQSTPLERDAVVQYPNRREPSTQQPGLTSAPLDYHSLEDQGMITGTMIDNHRYPTQPDDLNTEPRTQQRTEGEVTASCEHPVFIDPSLLENALSSLQDTRKPAEVEQNVAVSVPPKRREKAVTPHSRSNVSLLRRENEFLKILKESGGIVHPGSKEFLDAHVALLDTLALAGEPTSGLLGIKVDKRTIENTFESLENRGKVKVLKTAISTVTGAQRPTRIIYLPTVDQTQLDTFLTELGKSLHNAPYSVTSSTTASIPPSDLKVKRPAQPLRVLQSERGVDNIGHWSKSRNRADQLFQSDDQTIHDVLLTERTTLAQLYGFIPGKMVRAREFHLATLDIFQSSHDPLALALADKRVMKFSRYFQDLPIGIYCSLVSTLVQSDELSQILSTEEGRRTPVKDLPQSLQTLLQIGRPRSRERLLELFEILHHLNIVAPLQPSESPNPLICCGSNGDGPSSFDPFAGDISSTSYRTAPDYWLFHHEAALHLWVLSTASPPLWKTVSVSSRLEASHYWNELQPACESKSFAQNVTQTSPSQAFVPGYPFSRSIIRDVSWKATYELSWHQRQYLKRFMSHQTDEATVQDEEGGSTLEKVSWTISAPLSVVKDFLQKERTFKLRELNKAKLHTQGTEGNAENAEKMEQEKELLAKKVADAKARKEREWEAILNAVHPGPLDGVATTKVARVRKRYLQSGVASDRTRWEGEVRDALRTLRGAAKAVLPSVQRVAPPRPLQGLLTVPVAVPPPEATAAPSRPAGLPQPVANQPGKSIEQLIAEQGPAREDAKRKKRKQKKAEDADAEDGNRDEDDPSQRKSRFLWNKDYDDLAQDIHAILRVRSREVGGRMDWFAFRQIFPAVPRNSVRQRIASLREVQNNDIYMRRLEDQWYRLWQQYRGTEHLPDPNSQSQTEFDLIKHLQFLRKFVDKNALRVGFQETSTTLALPETVLQLYESWDILVKPDNAPVWEFLWDSKVDENREKGLLQTAFTTESDDILTNNGSSGNQEVQVTEAALKMVFGAPNENYVPASGAALLRSVGKRTVSRAKDNLLGRGVLSKVVRDPQRPRPGRTLKISEINQNALGGSIPQEVFNDATMLDALCKQQEDWREWSLRASDGDLAMLAQITSEGLVDFKLDTSGARAARVEIDWNSKKADDDHIETTIFTRFSTTPPLDAETDDTSASRARSPSAEGGDEGHGITAEGTIACCRKTSDGQVNCDSCLNNAIHAWTLQSDTKEQEISRRVLDVLEEAGPAGLDIGTLIANTVGGSCFETETVLSVLASLVDNPIPPIVLVGHSRPLVVSARQSDAWTVVISEEPRTNVLPRRWLDVRGVKMQEMWRAALRAVIGTIVFRPGISQAEIVWRLRSIYDRAEVIDVLKQLHEDGVLRRRISTNKVMCELGLIAVREEEKGLHWFLGDRRWYQGSLE